jgi:hypothetical protein
MEWIGKIAQDLFYNNSKNYFNFPDNKVSN